MPATAQMWLVTPILRWSRLYKSALPKARILLNRTINVSGDDFTVAIQKAFNLDFNAAEEIKALAETRAREINAAYEAIRKRRR